MQYLLWILCSCCDTLSFVRIVKEHINKFNRLGSKDLPPASQQGSGRVFWFDPGRHIAPVARMPFAWTRDIVSKFWTLLESSAPDPFSCTWYHTNISNITQFQSQLREIGEILGGRGHESFRPKEKGHKTWTCLVIAASFSANSASPLTKGNRHPLLSNASTVLITLSNRRKQKLTRPIHDPTSK